MASGYQQYGGNPYGQTEPGYAGHVQSNPYEGGGSGGYPSSNPYGGTNDQPLQPPPALQHEESNYSQGSHYSQPTPQTTHQGGAPLSNADFFKRIEGTQSRIKELTSRIAEIASIHQRLLSSTDRNVSSQLEHLVSETQRRNTQIKDEIKFLERDMARDPSNNTKKVQTDALKRSFKNQLQDFQKEESDYGKRYREQIARQYRIINPDATEAEVNEAANADWGDEGIFQQALKSNRSGQASSVLGAVRARHNDIQHIEKTMVELNILFEQLAEQVVIQDQNTVDIENQTENVNTDQKNAIGQLGNAVKSARNARKLKWWTLGIVVLIIAIVAIALGAYFGTQKNK